MNTTSSFVIYREFAIDETFDSDLTLRIDESIERMTGETSSRLQQTREEER